MTTPQRMMATVSQRMTAQQLAAFPNDGNRYELLEGELRMMSPAGNKHGRIAAMLTAELWNHVEANGLGSVYAAETGFLISKNPDTVRAPDVAFITQARLDSVGPVEGYWPGAPDLAAEVLPPHDSFTDVEDKALGWLDSGTRVAWAIDSKHRRVTIYRSRNDIVVLEADARLEESELLPGWSISIADLFG